MLPHEIILKLRDLFVLQNTLHWIKSITVKPKKGDEISAGHFKPINSKRYLTDCHEYIFHLTKSGDVQLDRLAVGVEYSDKSNITRWGHTGGRDKRCRGNNWFIPYETILSGRDARTARTPPHSRSRSRAWCMKLHGLREPGMVALDPFLGIRELRPRRAEMRCGGKFIGFEMDEQYLSEPGADSKITR